MLGRLFPPLTGQAERGNWPASPGSALSWLQHSLCFYYEAQVLLGPLRKHQIHGSTLDDTDVSFVVRLQVRSLGSAPFSHFVTVMAANCQSRHSIHTAPECQVPHPILNTRSVPQQQHSSARTFFFCDFDCLLLYYNC